MSLKLLRHTAKLFPYTTLFRSDGFGREAEVLGQDAADKAGHPVVVGGGGRAVQADGHVGALFQLLAAQPELAVVLDRDQDRKSTRLNSSHVSISYAVFCLKKKK